MLAQCNSNPHVPCRSNSLSNPRMQNKDIRRDNMEWLVSQRFNTLKALADATRTDAAVLSQIRNETRNMGGSIARQIETQLDLPEGWMDVPRPTGSTLTEEAAIRVIAVPIVGLALTSGSLEGEFRAALFPEDTPLTGVLFPSQDESAYALRAQGDFAQPRLRNDELIVVEPSKSTTPGDHVILRLKDGKSLIKALLYQRGDSTTFGSVNVGPASTFTAAEIESIQYIAAIFPQSARVQPMPFI